MIGDICISITASSPNLPIGPVVAVAGSAQRITIRGVPARQQDWRIARVVIEVTYPDGALQQVECQRDGYQWVCTLPPADVAGKVSDGICVVGCDDDGARYIMGRGDLYIMSAGIVPAPDTRSWAVRLVDEAPSTPHDGDMWLSADTLYLYHDGEAHTALDMDPYATHDDLYSTASDLCAYTDLQMSSATTSAIQDCRQYTTQIIGPVTLSVDDVYARMTKIEDDTTALCAQLSTSIQDRITVLTWLRPGRLYIHRPTETLSSVNKLMLIPTYGDLDEGTRHRCRIWLDYTAGRQPVQIIPSSRITVYHSGSRYSLSALPAGSVWDVDVEWWTLSGQTTISYYSAQATQD